MDKNVLAGILEKHRKWYKGETEGERANLRDADLSGANLRDADLRSANLSSADLSSANLRDADLRGADLSGANLRGADLSGANLRSANLRDADLRGANLRSANLRGADLSGANLRGADLSGADLRAANLRSANLSSADLSGANLRGANIEEKIKVKFFPLCCPESGSFIGWKKCRNNIIVKLEIPEDALRSSAYGRKCRCSKANVLELQSIDGNPVTINRINSDRDIGFWYGVGKTVSVDDFDEDRWKECSTGIHFFITRQEAVDYEL